MHNLFVEASHSRLELFKTLNCAGDADEEAIRDLLLLDLALEEQQVLLLQHHARSSLLQLSKQLEQMLACLSACAPVDAELA